MSDDPNFLKRALSEEGADHANSTVMFIFTGLLIGQILRHICNKFKLPYTPLLALIGIGIGFLNEYTKKWGDAAYFISHIDPHTFFLIFLPPLIFESAFSMDWHVIKVEFVQILILAGPVLVVAAFLTAL